MGKDPAPVRHEVGEALRQYRLYKQRQAEEYAGDDVERLAEAVKASAKEDVKSSLVYRR